MALPFRTVLGLFLAQILLCIHGNKMFHKESNPFFLLIISVALSICCFRFLRRSKSPDPSAVQPAYMPWLHALAGVLGLAAAYEELRKIWVKFPEPGRISDVIPQLKTMCERVFTGEFPYQPVVLGTHTPFPVYMPLHYIPIQVSNSFAIDVRWSPMILLALAIGTGGWWLAKSHPDAVWKRTLPAMLLLPLPVWGFIQWGDVDLAVSLEGIVAAWYVLLAAGLASRNHVLIAVGLTGALLSRYSLLFWVPLFAVLLWLYQPRKYSYRIWGSVFVAGMVLFVLPFYMRDPSIFSKIKAYYDGCSEASWVRPDDYTFYDALSLNIHLRQWMPGTPAQSLPYSHVPQIALQLMLVALGIFFYRKKWHNRMDIYTFSLVALSIMPMLFYIFSPMLFKYYMLMPLSVSAVLCWTTIARLKEG